ncbi:MAG: hypothetical protein QME51_05570 [Planctomycetota bacterium]|nr:hypothetical protein [Planctomycetota bacterium]MDI6787821.1 hypothetical protein [Planctomycetota bacterium]
MNGLYSHEKMAQEILNFINDGMKGVNRMFDQQKMAQTVLNLTKDYTTTTMHVMKTSMDMYEKTMDAMMKHGILAQEEGQKLLNDWTTRAKQGQQQYWNLMDENLKKWEGFFSPDGYSSQKKTTKS